MPQASRLPTLCRQAPGILGDDAPAGREPGSLDARNELIEEVNPLTLSPRLDCLGANRNGGMIFSLPVT